MYINVNLFHSYSEITLVTWIWLFTIVLFVELLYSRIEFCWNIIFMYDAVKLL